MTANPDPSTEGASAGAAFLAAVFDGEPAPTAPSGDLGLARVASWLRDRAVATARTGDPPWDALVDAVAVATELHEPSCPSGPYAEAAGPGSARCEAMDAVGRAVLCELRGLHLNADEGLAVALATDSQDTLTALAAWVAGLVVTVDGAGASAQVAVMTREHPYDQ